MKNFVVKMQEIIYVFDNYLKDGSLFKDTKFTDSLISLLNSKISNKSIKGAFYNFYSEQNNVYIPHIRIGHWSDSEKNISSIPEEISALLGTSSVIQSVIREYAIQLPSQVDKATDMIACYSFKLLNLVRNKTDYEIAEIYFKIYSKLMLKLEIQKSQALVDFNQFKAKYPKHFLSQFDIENVNITYDIGYVNDFCEDIGDWLKENIEDYQDIWFVCDRLFHHCNNSNNKFDLDEHYILKEFVNKVNG